MRTLPCAPFVRYPVDHSLSSRGLTTGPSNNRETLDTAIKSRYDGVLHGKAVFRLYPF